MPKERKLPLCGLLPLLTMPATGVRQVRTISFCFLYLTIIPNPPLPVKGEIAFLSPYFFRAPESAFFSSAAPCKGQAYGPQAAPAAPGQTGSARFGGSAAGPAARTPCELFPYKHPPTGKNTRQGRPHRVMLSRYSVISPAPARSCGSPPRSSRRAPDRCASRFRGNCW